MARNYLTAICLIIGCVLFLQDGCKKLVSSPENPEKVLIMPEATHLDEPATPKASPEARGPAGVSTAAPEKAEITPETNEPAPKITFEKLVCDFGEVEPGQKKAGEFKFTNTGQGTLKISGVDKCCGAVVNLSKEELAPGESGTVSVEYTSSYRPGIMKRQIHVNSNDKENPKVTLTIEVTIATKVDYQPKTITLLLTEENAGCPDITITGLDNKPFSIKSFKSTDDCITADVNSLEEATSFVLKPKVDIEKLKKRPSGYSGYIEVSLTHPAYSQVSINFTILPEFKTDPPVFIISNPEPQKPVTRDLWIFNNYGQDFEIESTSSQNNRIKVLSQEKISNGYHLNVEITPPADDSEQKIFTDSLIIHIKGKEPLEINCRGFFHSVRSSD